MNALVAILAGTLVATSIVVIGGSSLLGGQRRRRRDERRTAPRPGKTDGARTLRPSQGGLSRA